MRIHFTVGIYQQQGRRRGRVDRARAGALRRVHRRAPARVAPARAHDRAAARRPARARARSSRSCSSCRSAPSSCACRSTSRPKAGNIHGQHAADRRAALDERRPSSACSSITRLRRDMWFVTEDRADIPALAVALAREHWADARRRDDVDELLSQRQGSPDHDRVLGRAACRCSTCCRRARRTTAPPRAAPRHDRVLHELGVDETQRVAAGHDARSACRARRIASGCATCSAARGRARSPSSGRRAPARRTLIQQWIADRLAEDGYPIHKNLDRVPPRLAALRQAPDRRHVAISASGRSAASRCSTRRASARASCGSRTSTCSAGSASRARASAASPTSSAARSGAATSRSSPSSRASSTRGSSATRRASPRRSRSSPCPPRRRARPRSCCCTRSARSRSGCKTSRCIRSCRAPRSSSAPRCSRGARGPGVAIEIVRRVAEDAARATRRRARGHAERRARVRSRARPACRRGCSRSTSRSIPPRSRPRSPRA